MSTEQGVTQRRECVSLRSPCSICACGGMLAPAAYAVVIGSLCAINFLTGTAHLWFLWPALGWGIGLLAHAANLFAFSEDALRRMTARELRRERARHAASHDH